MKKTNEDNTVRLSVRALVEWVLRYGDIDSRRGGPAPEEAMRIGAEVHRKLQKASGADYQAEVALSRAFPLYEDACAGAEEPALKDTAPEDLPPLVTLLLEGRADGVIRASGGSPEVTVDEIKCVYRSVEDMTEPDPVHLAQAECYAFMLSEAEDLPEIGIRMTYVQLRVEDERGTVKVDADRVKHFLFSYTGEEIRTKCLSYVEAYRKWALFEVRHRIKRRESAADFPFPYTYRPGQKTIVREVYRTIQEQGKFFVQAPTGIGKTLAMLYPAVKAVGNGESDRIFYLTAKTVTANVAEEGMKVMCGNGLLFSYTKITAKEKMCVLPKPACDPLNCPRAKGHFDRVNDALYELITHENAVSSDLILAYAERYQLCPYELSLDVSLFTDVIICDYNYAFSPHVYLRRYFASGNQRDYILLIDEAHNLADRAREIYSAAILKEDVLGAKKLFPDDKKIVRRLDKANRTLLALKQECESVRIYREGSFPTALYNDLLGLREALSRYLALHPALKEADKVLDFFFEVSDFVDTVERMDEGYLCYAAFTEDGRFFVKLFCIRPSGRLSERLDAVGATVFFSATFLPVNYYKDLLTGTYEEKAMYVDSPFEREKRRIFVARDVSTKYSRRNEAEYRKVAAYLKAMVNATKGNYLAFFPSHKYLEEVKAVLSGEDTAFSVIAQKRNMREEERTAFLSEFSKEREESLLGLSVLGGLFSEGIDLKGEQLIGVAVVGTGLPQVGTERELMRDFYAEAGENGFDFAYRFPGFNKVMQAAGRLIRTSDDYGVILLLDERFRYRENRMIFPKEWDDCRETDLERIAEDVRDFWRSV